MKKTPSRPTSLNAVSPEVLALNNLCDNLGTDPTIEQIHDTAATFFARHLPPRHHQHAVSSDSDSSDDEEPAANPAAAVAKPLAKPAAESSDSESSDDDTPAVKRTSAQPHTKPSAAASDDSSSDLSTSDDDTTSEKLALAAKPGPPVAKPAAPTHAHAVDKETLRIFAAHGTAVRLWVHESLLNAEEIDQIHVDAEREEAANFLLDCALPFVCIAFCTVNRIEHNILLPSVSGKETTNGIYMMTKEVQREQLQKAFEECKFAKSRLSFYALETIKVNVRESKATQFTLYYVGKVGARNTLSLRQKQHRAGKYALVDQLFYLLNATGIPFMVEVGSCKTGVTPRYLMNAEGAAITLCKLLCGVLFGLGKILLNVGGASACSTTDHAVFDEYMVDLKSALMSDSTTSSTRVAHKQLRALIRYRIVQLIASSAGGKATRKHDCTEGTMHCTLCHKDIPPKKDRRTVTYKHRCRAKAGLLVQATRFFVLACAVCH